MLFCIAGIKAEMNTRYAGDLSNGESKLFEYVVSKEGITLQVQVTEGKLTLYGSHDNTNPNQAWHSYKLTGIQGNKDIVIPYPTAMKKQDESTVPFYYNLVGMENSKFSIKVVNESG